MPYSLGPCRECGGERFNVRIVTGGRFFLQQSLRKVPFFDRVKNYSGIEAISCTACGHTTFYATEPRNLRPNT